MTVLDWLKDGTRYSFTEANFMRIAYDRGCDPSADISSVSKRDRDLMDADVTFMAVLRSPSNTASLSQSHNGYQKTIGQEQDYYQDKKIKYAISIYRLYGDEKGEILESSTKKKISFLRIVDVHRL